VIDWRLASTVAQAVASAAPAPEASRSTATAAELEAFAAESARRVADYTGLVAVGELPPPETVDRRGWVAVNLRSMRSVLDPVAERAGAGLGPLAGPAKAAAGVLLALEVGAISGYLAGRVLGQYEFPVLDPTAPARLLFVGPNLEQAAGRLDTDPNGMLRWVALHETTHALQFTGVPWLRAHLASRVQQLVGALDTAIDPRRLLKLPSADDARALVEAVRRGELIQWVAGPERAALLDEVQALMALIEGYAEHVMDTVGEPILPELGELRSELERRRRERSGLLRLLEKVIGMDMKMRQYEEGKRFCDAVVAEGGIDALNRAWASPDALPTVAELRDPLAWLARTAP
jgi:coenzyme F420 biosynthesis associated uncharacterized protein